MQLTFSFLTGLYGIYRYEATADVALPTSPFLSYTRTDDEVSVVCLQGLLPVTHRKQEGYTVLKLHGPFDLGVTGVLAEVSHLLAKVEVPIFVISTFDTDYILIADVLKDKAATALVAAGHQHAA